MKPKAQVLGEKSLAASGVQKPAAAKDQKASISTEAPAGEELWDVWQGRLGYMQTWSLLVTRKDHQAHWGKRALSADRSQELCGWMGSQEVHGGSRPDGDQHLARRPGYEDLEQFGLKSITALKFLKGHRES